MKSNIDTRPVEPSQIPALDIVIARLGELRPEYKPAKFGKSFDLDVYRIVLERTERVNLDLTYNFLTNLSDGRSSFDSTYKAELMARLDWEIEQAIPPSKKI